MHYKNIIFVFSLFNKYFLFTPGSEPMIITFKIENENENK